MEHQQRDFRFGVVSGAPSAREWRDLVTQIESLGYSTLFLSDHLDLGGAHPSTLSPLPALAAAGALTSRLRLGTSVLNQDLRHPAVLAREAATVQLLSDGRLELGVGAGWAQYEYDWAGLRFDNAAERISRLHEYLDVVRALLGPDPVTFKGRYFDISAMPGAVGGITAPPIMVGGYGDQMLRLAARHAEIININAVGRPDARPDVLDRKVELVARDARPGAELATMVVMVVVSDAPRLTALTGRLDAIRRAGHHPPDGGLSPAELLDSPAFLVGTPEKICEVLLERRQRWGISYYLISYPDLTAFAPVVRMLAQA
jgi:probable F420-dependent oxidoreductase